MSKLVLGKGLNALIPTSEAGSSADNSFQLIPLDKMTPNPMQPRVNFSSESLAELADSLKQNGVMQPLLVRRTENGFAIIAGERRYRAARLAGLEKIPALILDDVNDERMLEMALVENIQRENLNPMELAEAYHRLIDKCHLTQSQMAERLGKSRTAIANQLRLLTLPQPVAQLVREGKLTEGHARAILALDTEAEMLTLAHRIVDSSLSVRETEQAARKRTRGRPAARRKIPEVIELENYLKALFGTSVKITTGKKKGKIEIDYYGNDDLSRILDLFKKIES